MPGSQAPKRPRADSFSSVMIDLYIVSSISLWLLRWRTTSPQHCWIEVQNVPTGIFPFLSLYFVTSNAIFRPTIANLCHTLIISSYQHELAYFMKNCSISFVPSRQEWLTASIFIVEFGRLSITSSTHALPAESSSSGLIISLLMTFRGRDTHLGSQSSSWSPTCISHCCCPKQPPIIRVVRI